MIKKKRIALITTWFQPKNGVAVNRMHAFAKYLSDDYEVEVFTDDVTTKTIEGEKFLIHYLSSDSVLNKLKHKTDDSWFRHNFISVVNVTKGILGYSTLKKWVNEAETKLQTQHEKNPFDLILSSYAPAEPHEVALRFKKKNSDVKWIADMRDEMSKNPTKPASEKRNLRQREAEINKYADAVTTVSLPILNDFRINMPDIGVFEEIRNGYDHNAAIVEKSRNEVFSIGYVGKFYGEISPKTFFEALSNLKQKGLIEVKIVMVGTYKTFHIPKLLMDSIKLVAKVEYAKAIEIMGSMDANLLVHPSGNRRGVYTGKLFDYISVGKPVIGVIDKEDVAAELIQEFSCGYIADFYDVAEIETILLQAYDDWKNGIVKRASDKDIATLHRKNEVKKLAKLIEKLTAQ